MSRSRSYTRHQAERFSKRGYRDLVNDFGKELKGIDLPTAKGVRVKTRCFCSDPYCCGNPRHKKGTIKLSKQEKNSNITLKEEIDYINNFFDNIDAETLLKDLIDCGLELDF